MTCNLLHTHKTPERPNHASEGVFILNQQMDCKRVPIDLISLKPVMNGLTTIDDMNSDNTVKQAWSEVNLLITRW